MKSVARVLPFLVLSLTACLSTQPTEIAQVSPAFRWDPPPGTKEPSQKLTIALVSPRIAKKSRLGGYEGKQYFDLFVRAIHTDTNRRSLRRGSR